ncbi:DNA-3-methyladenine glycosylase family protein [Burkholderia gladioli]|uniref:DNA-3-methyladenine glycosylase II n=1 Tax=Burkholderia gladioli TaxID=28095 RepID=A0A2A7S321_BURGA|nr:DNA-3-methyladenine glycosylase [Burkholderia gladioli]MBU9194753.1 DNA-3-methyladenine glycosylase [Burkholderia gladioli]MBU9421826.1 DNA-3-methyladenine glycosylase [Burkholderia gladioli]MDN8060517.1 DNA-3-methyladenine glycosylase [Burkholderia gladioli]PEH37695.1 DNA-3-methyladenine glycosylase [Burkholderia gladioli]QPQ84038.1 DNA-3-methyladenine glycosylase 2 family protein [Burkholderia gladioli]
MATGRKVPAKGAVRAATRSPATGRAPAGKVAAKRATDPRAGAVNGVAHSPAARGAAKPARAESAERELAAEFVDGAARKARANEAALPEPSAEAEEVVRPPYWDKASADLVKRDRILKKLIPKFGPAHLVKRGDPFVTLARSVVGQQISVSSAQAVWAAIEAACPKLAPQQVIRLGLEKLAACGLSKRKSEYIIDLAQHFVSGALHVDKWTSMEDEDVIAELTQIRGIGRWTAEMFLIFNLSRPDVLPLDDPGLIRAISVNYFSGEPVTRSEAREVAANWEPWRTVATWYMWRSLDPESGDA